MENSVESSCKFSDNSLPLVVVVANTDWNEEPRMRHHITQQLIRWNNVLFVEFFPNNSTIEKENFELFHHRLIIFRPKVNYKIHDSLYINLPFIHNLVNNSFKNITISKVRKLGYESVILFNFAWNFYQIYRTDLFKIKVYVCNDEFPLMFSKGNSWFKRQYQRNLFLKYEQRVAKSSNFCYTPHKPLREKLEMFCNDVKMLFHALNGPIIKLDDFSLKTATRERIKVGYAGFIHYRINIAWLISLLKEDIIDLYLIGPLSPDFELKLLTKFDNFHLVPSMPELAMVEKLGEMDVLIVPYRSDLEEVKVLTTVSKLFQYISTLKPIVISDLPNFIDLPDGVIYKANDNKDFVEKVFLAYKDDTVELREVRAKIALENTWEARGNQINLDLSKP